MKTISYRGQLDMGLQDQIRLKTNKGKVGYKITKFQVLSTLPGQGSGHEYIAQIYNKDQTGSIGGTVNFTDSELLAVVFQEFRNTAAGTGAGMNTTIIFDNAEFNQDIFISITDATGGTTPCNYYIELETMELSDIQSTQLTLKNLRTITS